MFLNHKKSTEVKDAKPKKITTKTTITKTTKINDSILSFVSDKTKKYTLLQFDKLVNDIYVNINKEKDQTYILKLISKHAKVSEGKIIFDSTTETNMTYKSLKSELQSSKSENINMFSYKNLSESSESDIIGDDNIEIWKYPGIVSPRENSSWWYRCEQLSQSPRL